ncbi:hypothetical protein ACH5RR_002335 [Cinchona calisaya]|uniref:LRR receptor-like serine/threonine-protein kinase At2g16250 n=1 Tax=Cinchona calisaya TaxID=153742 RepID=A0ABD3B7B6_9GENT
MTRIYDNWERLVRATLRREQFRLSSMRTPSDLSLASSSSSSFSFSAFPSRVPSFIFSGLLPGVSFTYHQILQVTNGLSQSNLIKHGQSGDLFYGVLEGGIEVVVKKIDLSSIQRESYYLISELEILHKVSHSRSVVPLVGHCLENMNEKFLVYKYMPKKDLSTYLYRKIAPDDVNDRLHIPSLDWDVRLKIAVGAAEGLYYLHHECIPPIVHRDIQASSILLDDNFEVRLGSLSEVCTAVEHDDRENKIARFFHLPKGSGRVTSGFASADHKQASFGCCH